MSDFRSSIPRFSTEHIKINLAFVEILEKVARQKNATKAQVAIAWILAQKPWIVPIPGTTNKNRMIENTKSIDVILSDNDLNEIKMAVSKIEASGERYPELHQRLIDR